MADEKNVGKDLTPTQKKTEQTIQDEALDIIKQAKAGVVPSSESSPAVRANVADSFKGLPMRDLIGSPLFAAAEAQQNLAAITLDYFQKIGFESDESGKPTNKTRIVEFMLNRPVEQDGEMKMLEQKVQAPFIGLLPTPSLLIDRVDIDFQMEVTSSNTEKSSSGAEANTKISARWWGVSTEISGKVTSSRENTRSTNQTAKYQVHVTATQQPQTEGLSKLMDIMASCVEPMTTKSS